MPTYVGMTETTPNYILLDSCFYRNNDFWYKTPIKERGIIIWKRDEAPLRHPTRNNSLKQGVLEGMQPLYHSKDS